MKKLTMLLSRELQRAIKTDEEWQALPMLADTLALINFVVEIGSTRRYPKKKRFDVTSPAKGSWGLLISPVHDEGRQLESIIDAYQRSHRISVEITLGITDVVVSFFMYFYQSGQKSHILLLKGGVEGNSGARLLEIVGGVN